MKANKYLLPTIALIGITSYLLIPSANQKDDTIVGPTPTDGTIIRMDMEEGDNKTRREAWFELMHKIEDGQEWKMVEHDNMMSIYQDKLRRKGERSTRDGLELVADGKLEGEWSERGASNIAGNIRISEYDRIDETLYVISDGGTLWKGALNGFSWQVLNQEIQFSKGLLEIAHLTDGTVRIIASINNAPYYSDDDGLTWSPSGIQTGGGSRLYNTFKVQNEETGIDEIFFLHRNGWGESITVRRSNVEEMNFTQIRSFATSDDRNVSMARVGNANELFVIEQKNATNSRLFQWDPESETFNNIESNTDMSSGSNGRLNLDAVTVNDTIRLFSYNGDSELFRSDDLGKSWQFVSVLPVEPWEVGLFISSSDPDNMLIGAVNAYRSNNGGKNWQIVNEWYEYYGNIETKLHADIMYFEEYIDEEGEPFILINNHGGLSITRDYGKNNNNIALYGLATAQYYDVRTYPADLKWVFTGSQDQGFQKGIVEDDGQIADFDQVVSGDYGHIEFTNNGTNLWTIYPNGSVSFYEEPTISGPTAGYTVDSSNETVWIAPMMADPDASEDIMYVAGGSAEGGAGSYMIKMTEANGSITAENMPFNFEQWGTISAMAASPINSDLWYVATTDGRFFTSIDRGQNFIISPLVGPGAHYLYGAGIWPSAVDEDVVYFCGSGYSNAAVFKSTDKGNSFESMSEGLPPTLVFNIVANEDESLLYAATEAGPYVYIVQDERWYDLSGANTPTQRYWSVEYLSELQVARFGTYGRGIWDFKLNKNLVSTNDPILLNDALTAYPNPVQDHLSLSTGVEYDGLYTARVYDLQGRLMQQTLIQLQNGVAQMDASTWKAGQYILSLVNKDQQLVEQIIKT